MTSRTARLSLRSRLLRVCCQLPRNRPLVVFAVAALWMASTTHGYDAVHGAHASRLSAEADCEPTWDHHVYIRKVAPHSTVPTGTRVTFHGIAMQKPGSTKGLVPIEGTRPSWTIVYQPVIHSLTVSTRDPELVMAGSTAAAFTPGYSGFYRIRLSSCGFVDEVTIHAIAVPPPQGNRPQAYWESIGPAGVNVGMDRASGRIDGGQVAALAVHRPGGPGSTVIYAAASSGGLWRSRDDGDFWIPLTDNQLVRGTPLVAFPGGPLGTLELGSVAIDPGTRRSSTLAPDRHGGGGSDNRFGPGLGVFKSTDGGYSWAPTGTADSCLNRWMARSVVYRLVIDPNDSQTLYAATNGGLYISTSAGACWTRPEAGFPPEPVPPVAKATDLVMDPAERGALYVAYPGIGVWRRTWSRSPVPPFPWTDTWQQLNHDIPAPANLGRLSLAMADGEPETVFLGVEEVVRNSKGDDISKRFRLIRSWDEGDHWFELANVPVGCDGGDECKHTNSLAIKRSVPAILYAGQVALFRYTEGGPGDDWRNVSGSHADHPTIGPAIHADQNDIVLVPDSPTGGEYSIYLANDGGVTKGRVDDDPSNTISWEQRTRGLVVGQSGRVAIAPHDSRFTAVGCGTTAT